MHRMTVAAEIDGVDSGAGVQFEDAASRTDVFFHMRVNLVPQVLQDDIAAVGLIIAKRLLAESLVDGLG